MQKLIIISGLSGAGKSTHALDLKTKITGSVIVSRDEERQHMFVDDRECDLTKAMVRLVAIVLLTGQTCIVDSCNLHEHDRIRWETLAIAFDIPMEWKALNTDIDICISRDAMRLNPVGVVAIEKQQKQQTMMNGDGI